jgi:type IV secretion system protein VirB4
MQLVPALTRNPRVIAREMPVSAHLPYARHVDDRTIETSSGLVLQTIQLDGFLFETADTEEINYRSQLRAAMLQAIGSPRFALYHHVCRRKAEVALSASFGDDFSRKLDARWRDRLAAREMYINDLFLTIVRRPMAGRVGLLDRARGLVARSLDGRAAEVAAEQRALDGAVEALLASLGRYGPRVLTVRDTEGGARSEPLEFLSYLYNAEMRPVLLPHGPIGDHLPFRRVSFGQDAFELAPAGTSVRKFGAMLSIKDYPGQTFPGMFDELNRTPVEITVTQSFASLERGEALGRMSLALRRMRSTDDDAISLRQDLVKAKDEVAGGRSVFGEHHTSVALRAEDLDTLNQQVAEVTAVLADLGITAVREDIAVEPAFWAQFPGNFGYIARKGVVSSRNFAGLASMHNFPVGRPSGNHWGEAVTLFETTAAGPYFFNFHRGDLGNFTIIGPSGSGKTVVLNFILAQARKFSPRIVFFDKDRGAELFIRAIGGEYDRLRAGQPSGLNPLQLDNTADNRRFLLQWISLLAGGLDTGETQIVKEAIEANFLAAPEHRRLRHLVELFSGHARPVAGDLAARMRPWWGEGERAWLFDNRQDRTDLAASTVGFDMTAILDDAAARTPALLYFFHRVEQRLDGTPAIIVVDEGWKALDDDVFVRRIKDWEKTIRKRNGIVGFATQSAQDALESRIASAIIEQAATQIFMINPKARAEDYIEGFGLTQHEFELIRTLPESSHCFLIKHGIDSVIARLDLTGEKELLTILSGREETVRLLDELMADKGGSPEAWMPFLLERV